MEQPPGFGTLEWYLWSVVVHGPNGSIGIPFWARWMYFAQGWASGQVSVMAGPEVAVSEVVLPVSLRPLAESVTNPNGK